MNNQQELLTTMINTVIKQRIIPQDVELNVPVHPLLKKLYIARGIISDKQLNHSTQALLSYQLLVGMDNAVEVLYQAVVEQKKIMIVGDFDTDGATSTALIITALAQFGIKNVNYIIPDRFEDGYGLSISVVKRAIEKQTQLIITVDNGVSAFEAIEFAKQHNIQVIITDHHLAPDDLPNADAIINPNLPYCSFPSKNLAGVGVTFYFMLAFRAYLRNHDWFKKHNIPEYNLANLLDLVALGTIADVVDLDQNNRILVQQGISRIRSGVCCAGIKALITIANKDIQKITSQDLSYYLSPRINAAGRMENMSLGVELLLAKDEQNAFESAEILENLNIERKSVEKNMHHEALAFIKELEQSTQEIPNGFVIFHPEFHQGVIGVLSSKIKDRFYRPVISFARAEAGYLKGSGRSVNGIHLRDILEQINLRDSSVIVCFGGHAMAAGLTIKEEKLPLFSQYFEESVNKILSHSKLENVIKTDGSVEKSWFNFNTAKIIKEGGPWGAGFPEPLFDGVFLLHQQKLLGNKHLRMVLEPLDEGILVNGILFNIDNTLWPDLSVKKVKIVYSLETDEFRGNQNVTLLIRHIWSID